MKSDKEKEFKEILESINNYIPELMKAGKWLVEANPHIYKFDLICTSILNRSVNFHKAFISLVHENNFIAAAPIVRVHMDSMLRLYASQLIDYNIDEFAQKILDGEQVGKMKDRDKQQMSDGYLARKISEEEGMDWVKNIYAQGSGYVHFSNLVTGQSIGYNKKESILNGRIRLDDDLVPLGEKIAASVCMMKVSNKIADMIMGWVEQKRSYPKEI